MRIAARRSIKWRALALVVVAMAALGAAMVPAAAVEFENSKFRRTAKHSSAMVRAWETGRSSAKASAFFVENKGRRLWVMTAKHVVGRSPVFSYRGRITKKAKKVASNRDFAVFEVNFGPGVSYQNVGKFHIWGGKPRLGQDIELFGFPRGYGGRLMHSRGCNIIPRGRLLHPTFFTCKDLDNWCRYARAADKSRATCLADAKDVAAGRERQCALPLKTRYTRRGSEAHTQSTHAMNCAVRLGSSGGPVIAMASGGRRGVLGMPSAVFVRVDGPYPPDLGVGLATFSQSFKRALQRLGVVVK
ncbi:MAG: hypothetical protein AAGJ94_13955 [Pseudomonadota bacterium]